MKYIFIKLIFVGFFFIQCAYVYAEVMIAPTRVVLERGQRSAELVIVNKGREEAAFRISIENRRMDINGAMLAAVEVAEGEQFAKEFIRYSPRRVIMPPGGKQTIRVSVNTNGLLPGEYRSHLRLMSAPTSAGRTLESANNTATDGISIQLVAIRSLTIPVIARVGDLQVEADIQSATIVRSSGKNKDDIFEASLNRNGSQSTYGDIEISVAGESQPIFYARGIAIYTPNTERRVKLPLPRDISAQLRGKKARIVYRSADPRRPGVITELTTVL